MMMILPVMFGMYSRLKKERRQKQRSQSDCAQ